MNRRSSSLYGIAVFALFVGLLAGCHQPLGYLLPAVVGEVQLLHRTVPIEQASTDLTLTAEQRDKLQLIIQARDYAEQVIGLNVGDSYHNFANLHGKALAWNLSASRKDAIEPYVWDIPFVGNEPFFGFFVYNQAIAERDRLVDLKYDTLLYEVDAYSTLGLFPDPVASPMLDRDRVTLIDTVIHELTHNTIFKSGAIVFNESLATFVGRTGALEFIDLHFGSNSALADEARHSFEDSDRFNAFMAQLVTDARAIYNSDRSYDEKLTAREALFDSARQQFADEVLPLMHDQEAYDAYTDFNYNNAFLLVNIRYNTDIDVFDSVYDMVGGDWNQALALFAQAAASDDPLEYLRSIAGE